MPLTIQLHPSERQTAFNLKRWRELLADRDLARLPHRIETDRHGHIARRLIPLWPHSQTTVRPLTSFSGREKAVRVVVFELSQGSDDRKYAPITGFCGDKAAGCVKETQCYEFVTSARSNRIEVRSALYYIAYHGR